MSLKRTSLFEEHQKLGGRIVPFAGWELPVQYTGVTDEHLACRKAAGLFDVSHMGEFEIEGPGAESFLNFVTTNDVTKIQIGQAQYTLFPNSDGGIVDDLLIYRRGPEKYLLVVNAANIDKDFRHVKSLEAEIGSRFGRFDLTNQSDAYTQIAIQGPNALKILSKITSCPLNEIKTYWFKEGSVLNGISAIIARTGYTGEDGFEVYCPWANGPAVWSALVHEGQAFGLKPCGLGARDTLRMEMKYPLYGHELSDQTNPLEAGLGWVTKLNKGDFLGRDKILAVKESGPDRKLIGFEIGDRRIPRAGYDLYDSKGEKRIGVVTSGTQSPCLDKAIGIGYVVSPLSDIGTPIAVDLRGKKMAAVIVETPFYKRPY